MNKNTEKVMELAVKKLVKTLEKTTDFALEHAPDIFKEMVTEAKIYATFAISISSIILIACLTAMYYSIPKAFETIRYYSENMGCGFVSMFAGVGAVTCVIIIAIHIAELVTLAKCPKLFLLKKLKELASPSKE